MLLGIVWLTSGEAIAQSASSKPASGPAFVAGKEVTHWSGMPIWGEKEAREYGFELPFPLGISGNVYSSKQDFHVPKVELGWHRGGLLDVGNLVQVRKVKVEETAWTLRFDSWVFPFLNLYAIAGYVEGEADVQLGPAMPPFLRTRSPKFDLNLEFGAPTLGLGGTLAAGFKPVKDRPTIVFGMADLNFTRTLVDFKHVVSSLDPVDVAVFSFRLGVRERILKNSPLGDVHGSLWGGAMYQGVQEVMTGRLGILDPTFRVHVEAVKPWNTILGSRLEIGKNISLTFEVGMGERKSVMLESTFRF